MKIDSDTESSNKYTNTEEEDIKDETNDNIENEILFIKFPPCFLMCTSKLVGIVCYIDFLSMFLTCLSLCNVCLQ